MDYAKFKVRQMQRQIATQGVRIDGVTFNLKNLKVAHSSELIIGSAYTCTLEPKAGYYLPQMISITGTTSTYGFKYDYTTGVIYIPSDEVIGDIVITAEADTVNNNVPAVLQIGGGTASFNSMSIKVAPSRGSSVSVTYGGITQTVIGDMTTETYNSPAQDVIFNFDESIPGGISLTIEGAYEGYGNTVSSSTDNKGNLTQSNNKYISSITNIGRPMSFTPYAFSDNTPTNNSTLKITSLPDSLRWIDEYAFSLDVVAVDPGYVLTINSLPPKLISVGTRGFYGCVGISADKLPETLTSVGNYGFAGCTGLTCREFPNSLVFIDPYAFRGCTNLALTSLPSGITHISQGAFANCTNLALTSLPEGVTNMDGYAFQNCTNLALTSLPKGIQTIASYAFQNCTNLALTSLPEGVTNIYSYAFDGCTNLALTSLPESVWNISEYAFQNCTNLALTSLPESIKLPSGAMYADIGAGAFYGCTSIITMTIPSGVTKIGDNAFMSTGLKTVIMRPTTPPTLGTSVFPSGVETITVPVGSGEAYRTATSWADYVDKIVEGSV